MWTALLGGHNSLHLQVTSMKAGGSEMWAAGRPSCPVAAPPRSWAGRAEPVVTGP